MARVTCPVCGKAYANKSAMGRHLRAEARKGEPRHRAYLNRKGYPCPVCGKLFQSKRGLASHMRQVHKGVKARPKPTKAKAQVQPPEAPSVPTPTPSPKGPVKKKWKQEEKAPVAFRTKKAKGKKVTYPIMEPQAALVTSKDWDEWKKRARKSALSQPVPPVTPRKESPHEEAAAEAGVDVREWRPFTDLEMERYAKTPVPEKGSIGISPDGKIADATLIWWDKVQAECPEFMPPSIKVREEFVDFPHPDAEEGLMPMLRMAFKMNREQVCHGRKPVNVLLQGPPGTGKSMAVEAFAAETGLPYFFIPANPETMGKDQLLGCMVQDKETGRFVWKDGPITLAARYGGILHIDEFTLLDPEVQQALHELLDSKRRLTLASVGQGVIRAHPDLLVVATCNPEELGTKGVKPLSEPLKDRFNMPILTGYPPLKQELLIVKHSLGFTDKEMEIPSRPEIEPGEGKYGDDLVRFMRAVSEIREEAVKEGNIPYVPSIRHAIDFAQYLKFGMNRNQALHTALTGNYLGMEREQVEDALLKQWTDYDRDLGR